MIMPMLFITQQVHTNKIFCRMYGLAVMLDIATPKVHVSIQNSNSSEDSIF